MATKRKLPPRRADGTFRKPKHRRNPPRRRMTRRVVRRAKRRS